MNKKEVFYERLLIGMLLSAAAGSLDAYSYLEHGEVFAGLQTGNLILLGINLGKLNLNQITQYLVSILFFAIGTIIVRWVQQQEELFKNRPFSISEGILMYEVALLIIVAIFSKILPNTVITGMLSLAASGQLQHFRKLKGGPFTSLMMTGNIRTTAESIYDGLFRGDQKALSKGIDTGLIIGSFTLGALLAGALTNVTGSFTIILSALILLIIIGLKYGEIKNKSLR